MVHLTRIVERSRIVCGSLAIAGFCDVEAGEGVDGHESCEVHAITAAAENVLVEHKVGTEKDQSCLEIDHGWVAGAWGHAGLCGVHSFLILIITILLYYFSHF